ncbi:hypothetical protein OEZ85_011977 [Tetradesmus obliquus]|uniref:Aminotransferase class V domain-containing protein n=1 Tax=Tetradesmus obliquus TaxID=3088 RepID=A0ABY8TSA6_TETOB|nr:hypothetical protein OEZ85_011977 [Tetradesmus obliquus]
MEQQLVQQLPSTGVGSKLPHLAECVYLDYNATTPIYPEVSEAMKPYIYELFGNPSSVHAYGQQTRAAVDKARQQVAGLINCSPDEVAFTSCGTESDNWALWGAVMARRGSSSSSSSSQQGLPHVVTSQIEHPAVTACLRSMAEHGLCTFTAVPVDSQGLISVTDVVSALTPNTVLVSIMHSNNEVGSLQPVAAIAAAVRQAAPGCLVHSDAAQSMGKVAVDVQQLGVDLLTLVGHKFGAPKGVAALYIRQGVQLANLLSGGSQERGRRGGTENVLLLAGLGAAAELAQLEADATAAHMRSMRDRLAAGLLAALPRHLVRINGPQDSALQLPNTLSISVKGLSAPSLLQMLAQKLAASAGAACHSSHGPAVSPVLQAMRLHPDYAVGTLRLSTGRHTTADEVDRAVTLIVGAARKQGLEFGSSGSSSDTANGTAAH